MGKNDSYAFIESKIADLKGSYPFLRQKSDAYVFTALCVKATFYKNPAIQFTDEIINNFLVDSISDGGVDALLSDPNSETDDLIICQSKFYKAISFDDVRNAVDKMIHFYNEMQRGNYETVNATVQNRYQQLNAEIGDESKIHFVFYTSASKNGIREDRVQKLLDDNGLDATKYLVEIYFADNIVKEIKEAESRRPTIENGKICMDRSKNFLCYEENAIIVNVSAFSIKELYAANGNNLLSMNLRYYIRNKEVDKSIKSTIADNPETFWFKNNGITILCDEFKVDGKEVKLRNFSFINGGQTTYLISRSKEVNRENDFFLPCKIIKNIGETTDEKNRFGLEIAQAANSQKAIKLSDLKANASEQLLFGQAMRTIGVFYQTKRGEVPPKDYKTPDKNTDMVEVGKLCLAGIFQRPATSRSKYSVFYIDKYYRFIFDGNQQKISKIVKDLLYIDTYFRYKFLKEFLKKVSKDELRDTLTPFANNARTVGIAFIVFAARYSQKNLSNDDVKILFDNFERECAYDDYLFDIFKKIDYVFPEALSNNKDKYDEILDKLFALIIYEGSSYWNDREGRKGVDASNFLKKDQNYYGILNSRWRTIRKEILEIFDGVEWN